jgi:mediator of replication checkpoint protein 1
MGSSRESSPANESSPIFPHQLTPNSKVKALLASLDDDSDDGNVSGSARARLLSTIAKKPASKPTSPLNTREKSQNGVLPREPEKDSETGDEEDDDEIVRPKGRIAARMHVAGDKSEPEAERLTEDARERVKRMLTTKSTSSEPTIGAVDLRRVTKTMPQSCHENGKLEYRVVVLLPQALRRSQLLRVCSSRLPNLRQLKMSLPMKISLPIHL